MRVLKKKKGTKKILKKFKRFIEDQKDLDPEFSRITDEFIREEINNTPKKKRFRL